MLCVIYQHFPRQLVLKVATLSPILQPEKPRRREIQPLLWVCCSKSVHLSQDLASPTSVRYDQCSQLACFAKQVLIAMEIEMGAGSS